MAKFEVGDLVKVKKGYRFYGEKHAEVISVGAEGDVLVRYTDGAPIGTTDLRGPIALKKVKDKPVSDEQHVATMKYWLDRNARRTRLASLVRSHVATRRLHPARRADAP